MARQTNPSNIAVIGMEWGDEGKGKIIDFLAEKADIIARFNGGNNAGHTIEANNKKIVVHLVPSGVMHKNKLNVVGNGLVIDPKILLHEIKNLEKNGIKISPQNLAISENAHVILLVIAGAGVYGSVLYLLKGISKQTLAEMLSAK